MRLSILSVFGLLGCTPDYGLNTIPIEKPLSVRVPGPPGLSVGPTDIAISGGCVGERGEVMLTATGETPTRVTGLDVVGEGWAVVDAPALPFILQPGEAIAIGVEGQVGEASLLVSSDDPAHPVRAVELFAVGNLPPTVALVAPFDQAIVESGAVELLAQVSDPDETMESLRVRWVSDVDGEIGTSEVDFSGQARLMWEEPRTAGHHELSVEVEDSCGGQDAGAIQICQEFSYEADNMALDTWAFEGSARWDTDNDWLEVTDARQRQVGSAFQLTEVSGEEVSIAFRFYMGDGTGADGIALTALDVSRATSYLGGVGGCLGYGKCSHSDDGLPGWTIEIDTYYNGFDPTPADHLSFHFDGNTYTPELWVALPEMEDNGWHTATIDVSAPHVRVAIDEIVYIDEEIEGHYAFPANIGFSASTGGQTNTHLIDALTVVERTCAPD
ncbi:MAG: hypothetical protein AAFV53_02040 [Myxococcota bacterium]